MTDLSFIKLDLSPKAFAEALQIGIDAFKHAKYREEIKKQEIEAKKSELADKEQARQIATLRAEQERQMAQFELLNYAIETASKLVDALYPGVDEKTRATQIEAKLSILIQPQEKRIPIPQDKETPYC